MTDLHNKAAFDKLMSDAGGNFAEAARRSGHPMTTLKNTRTHYEAGQVWLGGRWLAAEEPAPSNDPLVAQIKAHLKRCSYAQTIEQIADQFDASPRRVREAIASLENDHHVILDTNGDGVALGQEMRKTEEPAYIDFKKYKEFEYPIGLTADNHLGSKYERLDVLHSIYDRFEEYGVETVYQGGNIIDGEARFNKYDLYVAGGVEGQVQNLIEKWPQREGITTWFVSGDDHEGWYTQREHLNIGRKIEQDAIAAGREDLLHLGYMERDIKYEQEYGSATIRVIHAGGGSAYATSYTSQKYVESLQGGEKPSIVTVGHFHKYDHSYPREVHCIQMACTQDQTPFMRKKRLQAHVGGVVMWVKQNELGIFTSVKVEFMPYYDKKFYAFKW